MTTREIGFAALAALGLVVPWYFNVQFMLESNEVVFDAVGFMAAGFANPASSSLTVDLLVAFSTFIVWMFPEARRIGIRHSWLFLVLSLLVAFAFAFPLFMLVRERRLRAAASTAGTS